jgi:hypothetical protein
MLKELASQMAPPNIFAIRNAFRKNLSRAAFQAAGKLPISTATLISRNAVGA